MSIISYAQNFEDVMLWRALGHVTDGFYIDVGAQHPVVDSVSKAFYEKGWRGIHIEATPAYASLLRQDRPDETVLQAALATGHGTLTFYEIPETGLSTGDARIAREHSERGFTARELVVPCITLLDVFTQVGERDIHWLKIDVEGMEQEVLEGWGESKTRPWVVIVESTRPLTQDETHLAWESLLLSRGYKAVYFDGLNRFYIAEAHEELAAAFATSPNVFDGFALHGGASAPFCSHVNARHREEQEHRQQEIQRLKQERATYHEKTELLKQRLEQEVQAAETERLRLGLRLIDESDTHTARERTLTEQLHATQTEQRRLEREWTEREKSLIDLSAQSSQKSSQEQAALLRVLAQREREFTQQFLDTQHKAEQERTALVSAQVERERSLIQKHAERERVLLEQIQATQADQRRLEREWAEREKALTDLSAQASQEQAALLQALAQREKEFIQQLFDTQRKAEQEKTALASAQVERERSLAQQHAERERTLLAQIQATQADQRRLEREWAERKESLASQIGQANQKARQEQEIFLRTLAEREQGYGQQLLEIQKQAEQAKNEQTRAHIEYERSLVRMHAEREHALLGQIHSAQQELRHIEQNWAKRESTLGEELYALRSQAETVALAQRLQEQQWSLELSDRQRELNCLLETSSTLDAELRKQIKAEQLACNHLQKALDEAKWELAAIRNSISWRLTSPVRKLTTLFGQQGKVSTHPPRPVLDQAAPSSTEINPAQNSEPRFESGQTLPDTNSPTMPIPQSVAQIGEPAAAATIDELLSYHDEQFVRCAYLTILGREPDPDGFRYYVGRVRQGVSKIQILSQLRLSPEGKAHDTSLSGLNAAMIPYRLLKFPAIGWLLGFLVQGQRTSITHQKLNAIENQVYVLGNENQRRFAQLEHALTSLHQALTQQAQPAAIDLGDGATDSRITKIITDVRPPQPKGLKQVSPRTRNIYFRLKKAAAIHAKGVA